MAIEVIEVVSAVIARSDGRLLLTQRRAGTQFAFHWECPGGKVEPGDRGLKEALCRELMEELGMPATTNDLQLLFHDVLESPTGQKYRVNQYLFRSNTYHEPKPLEGQGLGWFSPEEIPGLQLCPSLERRWLQLVYVIYEHHEWPQSS